LIDPDLITEGSEVPDRWLVLSADTNDISPWSDRHFLLLTVLEIDGRVESEFSNDT